MPGKQQSQRMRQVDPRGQMAAIQALQTRSDDELEGEVRYKAMAQAVLGQRAAERFDAKAAREHFRRAIAAARPQERMALRRQADLALAVAERRPEDLRRAHERLGLEAPTGKQMFGMRVAAFLIPPASAGLLPRIRGIVVILLAIIAVFAVGFGIVTGISAATGGLSLDLRIFWGVLLALAVFAGLITFGIRRRRKAEAARAERLQATAR